MQLTLQFWGSKWGSISSPFCTPPTINQNLYLKNKKISIKSILALKEFE